MLIARARPLLGTVVSIQTNTHSGNETHVAHALSEALSVMARISRVMSAHHSDSDLGRLSRARSNDVLTLDAETVHVIRAAKYWTKLSRGAFNPSVAAQTLSRYKLRPGIHSDAVGSLDDIEVCSATDVRLAHPVHLDFGGIAKGYAVDRAIEVLISHGVRDALVNAGGDLRATGQRNWPIDVRHANLTLMDRRLSKKFSLCEQAVATSVAGALNPEFVFSRPHHKPIWKSVTVQANTCLAADVLTKWAMQSSLLCPDLRAVLRQNRGRMWRTQ